MPISVDWGAKDIYIPQSYLSLISGTTYELDVDQLRLDLKALEDDEEGMAHPDTHQHITTSTLSGTTFARQVEFINGYTITFEVGGYQVFCSGANHNIGDVMTNTTGPSLVINNSAGLIVGEGGGECAIAMINGVP